MSFLNPAARPSRSQSVAAAVAVQLGLGAALITGLSVHVFAPTASDPPIRVEPVPFTPPPPPPPPIIRDDLITPKLKTPEVPAYEDPEPQPMPGPQPAPGPGPGVNTAGPDQGAIAEPSHGVAPEPKPTQPVRAAAHGRAGNRFDDSDYPDSSRRAGDEGRTSVRYTIGSDGRARDCFVTSSSGHPRLDRETCSIIERRFRFDPAREGNRPVDEQRTQTVVWALRN